MEFRTFCFKFPTLKQISLKICQANFKDLLTRYPEVDTNAMGFPQGWEKEPLWRQIVGIRI